MKPIAVEFEFIHYICFIADRDAAFTFLNKIERTISKDKQAVVRLRTGQIELRLMHKDSKDRCVDIQIVRVSINLFRASFCLFSYY